MDFPWELVKAIGPWATLIIFFVWRDFQRETLLRARLSTLEDYQKTVLQDLLTKATAALTQSTECIKWMGHVIERITLICPRLYGKHCNDDNNPLE